MVAKRQTRSSLWPPLTYRSPERFRGLLTGAGLAVVDLLAEPLGVHSVAVCQRANPVAPALPADGWDPVCRAPLHGEAASV